VTVRTSHDTLLDLRDERREPDGIQNELGYGLSLYTVHVIELQNGDVGFSTVDTRMGRKIIDDESLISQPIARDIPSPMISICVAMARVVCPGVFAKAQAADVMTTPRSCIAQTEVVC
jgi:hypothetical protein